MEEVVEDVRLQRGGFMGTIASIVGVVAVASLILFLTGDPKAAAIVGTPLGIVVGYGSQYFMGLYQESQNKD
jgi:hypothetical protein